MSHILLENYITVDFNLKFAIYTVFEQFKHWKFWKIFSFFKTFIFFLYNQFVGIIKIYKIEFEKKLKWGDVYDSNKIFHSTPVNSKFF